MNEKEKIIKKLEEISSSIKSYDGEHLFPDMSSPLEAYHASRQVVTNIGGTIVGYFTEHNTQATIGISEGGHDFVLYKHYLIDFWLYETHQERDCIFDLDDPDDGKKVQVLYGERDAWEVSQ